VANSTSRQLTFLLASALIGLAIVPVLVLSPNLAYFQVSFGRPLIGGLFSALCVLGILTSLYPVKCRGMFGKSQKPAAANKLNIVGHHPECKKYDKNRIPFADRSVCAACSGLLVGAVVALGAAGDYFFVVNSFAVGSVLLLLLCEAFMLLGVAQIFFRNYVKALVNLFFVVGSSVALIEVDLLAKNLLVDFYMLGLVAFMLWLRIALSDWHNRRTCQNCRKCF
jgi:hypothetical protein